MLKLNIGSHNKRVKGYKNVDVLELPNVDYICDITRVPWLFAPTSVPEIDNDLRASVDVGENVVDEILMVEVLEHISWRITDKVLSECYRVLKQGGKLHIQVPDCGNMMMAFCADLISDKIPHKGGEVEILKKQSETGMLVHPDRWLMAFCGAQKHQYDTHMNIFTKQRMQDFLENAGFDKIDFIDDPLKWKIKVNCYKPI